MNASVLKTEVPLKGPRVRISPSPPKRFAVPLKSNMAKNNPQIERPAAEAAFSWSHPDYILYVKDKRWYAISVAVLVLMVAWAIWQKDYLFAIFCVMAYLVVLLYENRQPEIIEFAITPQGIRSGSSFHNWKLISHFFIIYEADGIKNLYIEFVNPLRGRMIIPLDGQNAVAVRTYLLKFLREDLEREAEPISEQLRRFLKL